MVPHTACGTPGRVGSIGAATYRFRATQAPKGLHNRIPGNAATPLFGFLNSPAQVDAPFQKVQTPLCLSHHPASPLTTEEVIHRARNGYGRMDRKEVTT